MEQLWTFLLSNLEEVVSFGCSEKENQLYFITGKDLMITQNG